MRPLSAPTAHKPLTTRRLVTPVVVSTLLLLFCGNALAALEDDWRRALARRDMQALETLLAQGVGADISAEGGRTALMYAALSGERRLVRALLDAGANVNAANSGGGTPLMYAALVGDGEAVDLLLGHGADPRRVASNGWTPLMYAAAKGHIAVVEQLIRHGADPNAPDIYGWTPLMRAVRENRLRVVEALLGIGQVNIRAQDEHGASALHHAAEMGFVDIVRRLVAAGASTQLTDQNGLTPWMRASAKGHLDVIEAMGPAAAGR